MALSTRSLESSAWPRRQFRAPEADRGLLVKPAEHSPIELIARNRSLLENSDTLIGAERLADLRRACRRDVLRNACEYTARLRGVRPEMPSIDDDLVVVGHQPGLFHPGVWLKHWSADAIAKRAGGIALNIVIDNDLCDRLSIDVPVGPASSPRTTAVSLDRDFEERPWEDLRLKEPEAFRDAGQRVCEAMKDWGYEPAACAAWQQIEHIDECDSVVDHLTRIRHKMQLAGGAEMLEVPMRNVARLPSFAQFVAHIVQKIASLSAAYNEGLATYRQLNKLRNDAHPMPNLARERDLFEVPLWIWRAGDQQRRPLWAQPDGCGVRLFDRTGDGDTSPIAFVRDHECDWDMWHRMLTDLDHQGYRVRPRALMTTLFLRLCLADLFIHGIGGAKYDEVTDWIVRHFIGIEPPEFLTVSGTFRLPLKRNASTEADLRRLKRKQRDFVHNPDRHGAVGPLVDEKQALIAEQREAANGNGSRRENRKRYLRLREINEQLASQLSSKSDEFDEQVKVVERDIRANRILDSREYSWTLAEHDTLQQWLNESANRVANGPA